MSRSTVENHEFSDTEFSCGDTNRTRSKQKCKEENNNEVDALSKELSMGCVIDTIKRPSNICVENYVEKDIIGDHNDDHDDEEAYSDDFEDINGVDEADTDKNNKELRSNKADTDKNNTKSAEVDRRKSDESQKLKDEVSKCSTDGSTDKTNSSKTRSVKRRSAINRRGSATIPIKGTSLSSISIPPNMRKNMSFTNERLREIERQNHILLKKILNARNKQQSSIPKLPEKKSVTKKMVPPAAVSRKQQQSKIDRENMILLKKIQRAKSSVSSLRR